MKPPILVNDSTVRTAAGDLSVYETLETAELNSEPDEIGDECLTYFDSEGRLLEPQSVDGIHVRFQALEAEPTHQDLLRTVILDFFRKVGHSRLGLSEEWCEQAALPDLVGKALDKFGTS